MDGQDSFYGDCVYAVYSREQLNPGVWVQQGCNNAILNRLIAAIFFEGQDKIACKRSRFRKKGPTRNFFRCDCVIRENK